MGRNENLYVTESAKSVAQFVADFSIVVKANKFVISNFESMNMKTTFHEHGGEVPDDFDLHMIQLCKPTKADKSLTANLERAIMMPKFVHVFSQDDRTQVRYLSYNPEHITALVPDDPGFPKSLTQSFAQIRAMIDEAK